MIHPVYGICFALCAGSIQTAISRFVASNAYKGKQIFRTSLVISLTMGIVLAAVIVRLSDPLAHYILLKGRLSSAALFFHAFRETAIPLMTLALPLMGNRLVLNILSSTEAIWIPNSLGFYGLSKEETFSVYGVLTGMAMPFILFHSAITNSMAMLLLPTVAEAQAGGNESRISQTIAMSLAVSVSLSCHHHGEHLKRAWENHHYVSSEYYSPGSASGFCTHRYSPVRHHGISAGNAGQ